MQIINKVKELKLVSADEFLALTPNELKETDEVIKNGEKIKWELPKE